MKNVKMQFAVLISLILCVAIVATIMGVYFWGLDNHGAYYYDYNKLKENVSMVELIEYSATDAIMTRSKKDIAAFDFEKSETLHTLEQSRIDKFCIAFSKIKFFEDEDFPNTPIGQCIKLTYTNGDFLIVIAWQKEEHNYCYGTHLYDKDGNIKEAMWLSDLQDFYNLLNNFFGEVA